MYDMEESSASYIYYNSEDEDSGHSKSKTKQELKSLNLLNNFPVISTNMKPPKPSENDVKLEALSNVTLENSRPYLRRENFLQTYKAFMLYLDRLLITDLTYIFNNRKASSSSSLQGQPQFLNKATSSKLSQKFLEKQLKKQKQLLEFNQLPPRNQGQQQHQRLFNGNQQQQQQERQDDEESQMQTQKQECSIPIEFNPQIYENSSQLQEINANPDNYSIDSDETESADGEVEEIGENNNNRSSLVGYELNRAGLISDYLIASFAAKGIMYENEIYRYLLERSMNSPLLKNYAEKIFRKYFKDSENLKSFEREYGYQKGKINYFDPDFFGALSVQITGGLVVLTLKLSCFKHKLYLRVMMAMYKKLLRLLLILDIIFTRLFNLSGFKLVYSVSFTFNYTENQMKKQNMPDSGIVQLGHNIRVRFIYQQSDEGLNQKVEFKSED